MRIDYLGATLIVFNPAYLMGFCIKENIITTYLFFKDEELFLRLFS